jgi:SAM-dependent methyltransferase
MIPFFEQFALPRGPLGIVAGWALAQHNQSANRICIDALAVESHPSPRVLEIGFGPGWALAQLARPAHRPRPDGRPSLVGIEASETMLASARRRLAQPIADGVVALSLGDVAALAEPDSSFTHALAVYSLMFWPDPGAGLREIARVLAPGGRIALAVRVRGSGWFTRDPGLRERVDEERFLREALPEAGFDAVDLRHVAERTISDSLYVSAVRRG